MVTGWRRAFCTSIPKKQDAPVLPEKQQQQSNSTKSPRFSSKFGFFSNPSTPRLQTQPVSSPSLRCRTSSIAIPTSSLPNSPKLHYRTSHLSNPSSPKSPSSFSFLKSTLCISKGGRCGICLESVKAGHGTAIFTAECSHSFHFHCVAAHIRKQQLVKQTCPVCSTTWNELPLLSLYQQPKTKTKPFRVYDDDEPLGSPISLSQFNPIPESEEIENDDVEEEEFQGFFVTPRSNSNDGKVGIKLSQEAAMVASSGRGYESYAVVIKVTAPMVTRGVKRAAVDLVTVLDVSGSAMRLRMAKRAMRTIISLLNEKDRLSIVIFSSSSKRLLPLKKMSSSGRSSARRIVDALGSNGEGMSVNDALKKAAKVLEDRREKNAFASIMILYDGIEKQSSSSIVSTTRLANSEIPVHSFGFGSCTHAHNEDAFVETVNSLLSVMVQDVRLQLGFVSGSAPAEISSVYSLTARPALLGSNYVRVGDLHSGEERELLVELKVAVSSRGSHRVMSVRSSYRDPLSQEMVYSKDERQILPPLTQTVRSSSCVSVARLRNLHVSTRAVAESRGLIERNDLAGAHLLLTSARALLVQSGSAEEFIRGLDSELAELNRRRQRQRANNNSNINSVNNNGQVVEEKIEPSTPTSAWRAAERLAKVAIMRKHMNRVSDLHGFENARF